MATQQFESAKKLILHFTQKNRMDPESDIKGVMPGESSPATGPAASGERGGPCRGPRHHGSLMPGWVLLPHPVPFGLETRVR